jgi:DNA polymerase-3 subunit beta
MEPSEFPAMPEPKEIGNVECAGSSLANMLGSVAFCQSTDASRYILMGVHVELKDGQFFIEATNGARIARNVKTVDSKSAFSLIIPSFTVSILSKLLREAASVTLSAGERHVSARITHADGNGETLVVSKVVEGGYPNTAQVIPSKVNGTIKVNREQLAGLVSRVSIACTELAKAIKLDVSAKEITLSAASSENGEANEAMPIEYDGPAMNLALSNTMFSEALSNIGGETITVALIDHVSPVVFRNDDPGYIHIAMPFRTL